MFGVFLVAGLLSVAMASGLPAPEARHPAQPDRINVVLMSMDTTRRDHLSFYGYGRHTSPNLKHLMADRGVVFDTAIAPHTNTAPSHASMLTGLYPATHGIRRNGMHLAPGVVTLGQLLRKHGYATGGFVSGWTLTRHTGLQRGFDHYDDDIPGHGWHQRRPAWATYAAAAPWVTRQVRKGRPFFLFFHLFDPHHPYTSPPGYAEPFLPAGRHHFHTRNDPALGHVRSQVLAQVGPVGAQEFVSRYDGEIAYADSTMGRLLALLDRLGVADHTLVIFVADHGETLLERPFVFAHGGRAYDEQIRVPMVMRLPHDRYAGRRVPDQVSHVDLLPTVLDVLGFRAPAGVAGRSLVPLLEGRSLPARPAFSSARPEPSFVPEIHAPLERRGLVSTIRLPTLKLIEYPMFGNRWYQQLFDLGDDPGEKHDISAAHPDLVKKLHRELERWREATGGVEREPPPKLSPRVEKALRALGYIK